MSDRSSNHIAIIMYSVAAPPDMQFGTPSPKGNGTWTGTVGVFQREQGDMTLMITNSDGKYAIMDLARLVPSDFIVIVSLKPTPPPQYFVIIRPFTVTVWMFVASSILIWAGFFWMLQKIRSQASGEKTVTLNWSLFHSFAVILEDPPPKIPNHSTGRILLGWWLLSCLILTTLFRSTLVSQLSVQSKTKPIDNFEDLISLSNYRWGIHDTLLGAQPKLYFTNEEDPVIVRVYRGSEVRSSSDSQKILGKCICPGQDSNLLLCFGYIGRKSTFTHSVIKRETKGLGLNHGRYLS
ncbi:glutamate receptor ionotropic, kainate glr-3-like [Macrobrachium rosenbergii]|uniref:glutamate receptor ionotropic, kainate glr-3-like n=1 Tax=Macrobrachium rosenbergii TaxID=79674 RepID=UPI0034D622F3